MRRARLWPGFLLETWFAKEAALICSKSAGICSFD